MEKLKLLLSVRLFFKKKWISVSIKNLNCVSFAYAFLILIQSKTYMCGVLLTKFIFIPKIYMFFDFCYNIILMKL